MRRPQLTYANVVSSLALFIALGGTSYGLARNSIGNRELKRNAVTSAKVKDRSLAAIDLAASVRLGGQRGQRGPQGPAGPAGAVNATPDPWQVLPFDPDWGNYGAGFELAGYRKDQLGRISLRGLVTRLDGLPGDEVIAVLPPGYRPAMTQLFAAESQGNEARIDIRPNGEIAFRSGPPQTERDYVSLSDISYWPD